MAYIQNRIGDRKYPVATVSDSIFHGLKSSGIPSILLYWKAVMTSAPSYCEKPLTSLVNQKNDGNEAGNGIYLKTKRQHA